MYGDRRRSIAWARGQHTSSDPLVLVLMVLMVVVVLLVMERSGVPTQRLLSGRGPEVLGDDGDEPAERPPHHGAVGYLVVGPAVEAQERQEGLALALHPAGLPVLAERERRLQERRPRRPRELLLRQRGGGLVPSLGRLQTSQQPDSSRQPPAPHTLTYYCIHS